MIKIDGKKISEKILRELKSGLITKKFLAIFVVGNDKATESFVLQKEKAAKEIGIDFRVYNFEPDISNDQLREKIRTITASKTCGGAVLQLPLPPSANPAYVLNAIPVEKDIDVLSEKSIGSFYNGRLKIFPPSISAVKEILKEAGMSENEIKEVAVVGQGKLVGKPITTWLLGKTPKVLALDKGSDLKDLKNADLVILGAGSPGIIKANMLKKGAGLIDFGYGNKESSDGKLKLSGDFDAESIQDVGEDHLNFYTPTPGGTGPILVACLMKNFLELNKV